MAAIATTYLEAGRSLAERIAERNAELMSRQQSRRRKAVTPEFAFAKHLDNSRLVKAADPVRARQMRVFLATIFVLCSLVMVYGLQHFTVIESGYKVEAERQTLEKLHEENRQLKLRAAQLSQPERLDAYARAHGLVEPQPGQLVTPNGPMANAPTLAQVDASSAETTSVAR